MDQSNQSACLHRKGNYLVRQKKRMWKIYLTFITTELQSKHKEIKAMMNQMLKLKLFILKTKKALRASAG